MTDVLFFFLFFLEVVSDDDEVSEPEEDLALLDSEERRSSDSDITGDALRFLPFFKFFFSAFLLMLPILPAGISVEGSYFCLIWTLTLFLFLLLI